MFKKLEKKTLLVLVATVACLLVAGTMSASTLKYMSAPKATVNATVVELDYFDEYDSSSETWEEGYNVYVDYEYEGVKYLHVYFGRDYNSTDKEVGQTISIEIYRENPGEIAQSKGINAFIFLAFGAIMVVLSAVMVSRDLKYAKEQQAKEIGC